MLNFFLLLSLSDLFFFSYSFAFVCQEKKCTTFSLSLHLLQHFFPSSEDHDLFQVIQLLFLRSVFFLFLPTNNVQRFRHFASFFLPLLPTSILYVPHHFLSTTTRRQYVPIDHRRYTFFFRDGGNQSYRDYEIVCIHSHNKYPINI